MSRKHYTVVAQILADRYISDGPTWSNYGGWVN